MPASHLFILCCFFTFRFLFLSFLRETFLGGSETLDLLLLFKRCERLSVLFRGQRLILHLGTPLDVLDELVEALNPRVVLVLLQKEFALGHLLVEALAKHLLVSDLLVVDHETIGLNSDELWLGIWEQLPLLRNAQVFQSGALHAHEGGAPAPITTPALLLVPLRLVLRHFKLIA